MPYKYNDKWHRYARHFVKEKARTGRVKLRGQKQYASFLHQAWEHLGQKDPLDLTLQDMEYLEASWPKDVNTKATQMRVIRNFLRKCGNQDAVHWEVRSRPVPKADRVFLSEEAVEEIRETAHLMGPEVELIYSLGVDNSLRAGDQQRITIGQARQLLLTGDAVILSKGHGEGKRRFLALNIMTRPALKAYLERRDKLVKKWGYDPGNLFVTESQGPLRNMSPQAIGVRIVWLSKKVGLYFRSHDLRATYGNRQMKNGEDLMTIASLMAIENPNLAFQRYIGKSQAEQRAAQDRLAKRGRRTP